MLTSLFRPVPKWSMATAREHIQNHELDSYNLVDVRQPEEYAEGHIPGATSIPLGELPRRAESLDPEKLTLVYCRSGGRAANGVMLLIRAGFADVHSIGGFMEWRGLAATGAPEAAMAVFDPAHEPAEYVAIAWGMEEGARRFYLELGEHLPELGEALATLAAGEEIHRDRLAGLYREELGRDDELSGAGEVMEGGIDRQTALDWARSRPLADVLEFLVTMEANAHDRYVVVGRAIGGRIERIFVELAEAERHHIDQLMEMFATARAV